MTITPADLDAIRARDLAFGDGESEDASDIAQDRHALIAEVERLRAALSVAERAASLCAGEVVEARAMLAATKADREADPCPGSRGW